MFSMQQAIRSIVVGAVLARERWESGVAYNPLSRETAQDPYPVYAVLWERDPVHRSRLMNAWLFTRCTRLQFVRRMAPKSCLSNNYGMGKGETTCQRTTDGN